MQAAILESLPIALGMIVATLPLLAVPLILAARPDWLAAVGFVAGWMAGILALGGAVIAFADLSAPAPRSPAVWLVWARLALGLALIGLAVWKWQRRPPPGADPELPGWMARMETMGAGTAMGLAVLLVVLNPKNAVLVASGALAIASASYVPVMQAGALMVFAVVASLGIASPLILRVTLGQAAAQPLGRLKRVLARRNHHIMALVLLALGGIVVVSALAEF